MASYALEESRPTKLDDNNIYDRSEQYNDDEDQEEEDNDDFSNINTAKSRDGVVKSSDQSKQAKQEATTTASWGPSHLDLENDPILSTELQQFHNAHLPQQQHSQQHHSMLTGNFHSIVLKSSRFYVQITFHCFFDPFIIVTPEKKEEKQIIIIESR